MTRRDTDNERMRKHAEQAATRAKGRQRESTVAARRRRAIKIKQKPR